MNKNLQRVLILLCMSSLSPSLLVAIGSTGRSDVNMEGVGQAEPTAKRSQGVSIRQLLQEGKIPAVPLNGVLDLSKKNISDLTGLQEIKDLNKLIVLDLSDNKITELPTGIFSNLKNLKSLILTKNKLESIDVNIFKGLNELGSLALANNKIAMPQEGTFDDLKNLLFISFDFNSLEELPRGLFKKNRELKEIVARNTSYIKKNPDKEYRGGALENFFQEKVYIDFQ